MTEPIVFPPAPLPLPHLPFHPFAHGILGPELHAPRMGIDVEDDEGLGLGGQHDGLPITPELNFVGQILAGSDEKVPKTHQGVVELVKGGGQEEVGGAVAELVEVEGDLPRSGQAGEGEDGRVAGRV